MPGERLETEVKVKALEARPIYAFGETFQPWLVAKPATLKGNLAIIPIEVPEVPDHPGEMLLTTIKVTANGGQSFEVPVTLKVEEGYAKPTAVAVDTKVGPREKRRRPSRTSTSPRPAKKKIGTGRRRSVAAGAAILLDLDNGRIDKGLACVGWALPTITALVGIAHRYCIGGDAHPT